MKSESRRAYEALMAVYPFSSEDLPGEEWRPIPDYAEYAVSNYGRIKSSKYKSPRIIRPQLVCGYLHLGLHKDASAKNVFIHRLVAELFIENSVGLSEVNHKDGHKLNNFVGNLEWVSRAENMRHAYAHGLSKPGVARSDAKIKDEASIIYIRDNPEGLLQRELAVMFGVNRATISYIQSGKTYKGEGGVIKGSWERIPEAVREEIKRRYKKGVKGSGIKSLAKEFGRHPASIWYIVREENLHGAAAPKPVTEEERREIRRLHVKNSKEFGAVALAKKFNRCRGTIMKVVKAK